MCNYRQKSPEHWIFSIVTLQTDTHYRLGRHLSIVCVDAKYREAFVVRRQSSRQLDYSTIDILQVYQLFGYIYIHIPGSNSIIICVSTYSIRVIAIRRIGTNT